MTAASLAGAAILAVPLLLVAWALLWRTLRPVFWFAVALILVATGYLIATGATEDIGGAVLPQSAPSPAS